MVEGGFENELFVTRAIMTTSHTLACHGPKTQQPSPRPHAQSPVVTYTDTSKLDRGRTTCALNNRLDKHITRNVWTDAPPVICKHDPPPDPRRRAARNYTVHYSFIALHAHTPDVHLWLNLSRDRAIPNNQLVGRACRINMSIPWYTIRTNHRFSFTRNSTILFQHHIAVFAVECAININIYGRNNNLHDPVPYIESNAAFGSNIPRFLCKLHLVPIAIVPFLIQVIHSQHVRSATIRKGRYLFCGRPPQHNKRRSPISTKRSQVISI